MGQAGWEWPVQALQACWLARLWTLAHRGELHGDPVLHALRDAGSWTAAVALGACVLLAA